MKLKIILNYHFDSVLFNDLYKSLNEFEQFDMDRPSPLCKIEIFYKKLT
jgi:hypothetical protein